MEKCENTEKKPKRRVRVGRVLLIVLLVLLTAVGFLYYSVCKAPGKLDDPAQLAAEEPMPVRERFRFSAAEGTVQLRIGSPDIWKFVLDHAGEDFLELVNRELSAYSLSVSGCGIHIDEKGVQLNLELFYEDIRLLAKVPCMIEVDGQHFSLRPAGVKLGVIPLPAEEYLSDLKIEVDFQLPVISSMTGIVYEKDAIWITGSIKEDMQSLVAPDRALYWAALFDESMQPLVDAMTTEEDYTALLTDLEQEPERLEKVYRDLFMMAGEAHTQEYLDSRMNLTQRLFPGIDFTGREEGKTQQLERIEPLASILRRFFASVLTDYNWNDFRMSEGEFLRKETPFHPHNYGTGSYDALYQVLDTDEFFLVLVDVEDGYTQKTPVLSELADENQQFTRPVDFGKPYVLGCVLRGVSGAPYLLYETQTDTGENMQTLQPLTEQQVKELRVPGKFGVWAG